MTTEHRYINKFYVLFFILVLLSGLWAPGSAYSKIYIDLSSPTIRKLPISLKTAGHPKRIEIYGIIKKDLEITGLFSFVDPDLPGAEIAARLDVDMSGGLKVILSVNDMIRGKEVRKLRLSSSRVNIRSMSHSISDHIYNVATGKKGIFRTKISYLVSSKSGKKNLRLMTWDGFDSMKLSSRGLTSSHSWSSNGKYIFYSAERNRKWKIFMRSLREPKEAVLFSSKGLNIVGGATADNLISLSSSRDGSSEIYTMNIYGQKLRKLTRSFGIDVSPVFSPDGSKLAFVSDRGGTPQIYTMGADGKDQRRVTFQGSYNTSPAWSPDGKTIAYVGRTNGKNQIFVVQSDGREARQLTFNGNNENPSFSPDGLLIAYDSDRDGRSGIYLMRFNGEGKKRITPKYLKATAPQWSPYLK